MLNLRLPGGRRFWMRMMLILFVLLLIGTGGFILSASAWIQEQDIRSLDQPLPEPTVIYDRYNEPAARISGSRIIPVAFAELPQSLKDAIVAVEDRRYYEHTGLDAGALVRAFYKNTKSGGIVQGGSTITQQLAKNVLLSSEQSYSRKLKEAAMAVKIEATYSKDEILEMYLNQIYFGEGAWGAGSASRVYFGKQVSELTLAESAMLAALPKAPSNYSPFVDAKKALDRRNLVLKLMHEQDMIAEHEYEAALQEPLPTQRAEGDELRGKYPAYVNHVIEEAIERYGLSEDEILRGGLRIYTNLEPAVQGAMEEVYADEAFFPASEAEHKVQSAAAIIDPRTGGIRGLVGGRDEQVYRGFNRATQLQRQPGSAFKPLAVYAAALDAGYTPFSKLYDGPLDINGYKPQNYDRRTRGEVTLKQAIVSSYNIPAVWLLNELGAAKGLSYLERMGFKLTAEDRNLSIALGGLSKGVSPLQMAAAYGSFANAGILVESHAITKVVFRDGRKAITAEPQHNQIVSPSTAYTMTRMLQSAVEEGTGKRALLDRPTAGKTGTTQLPDTKGFEGIDGTRDVWFAGYTPELAAAVWMGYDKTDSAHYLTSTGGTYPAALFQAMMSKALQAVPVMPFSIPEGYQEPQQPQEPRSSVQEDDEKQERKREREFRKEQEKRLKQLEKAIRKRRGRD